MRTWKRRSQRWSAPVIKFRGERMKVENAQRKILRWARLAGLMLAALAVLSAGGARETLADEPYARSKDYDLQHSKIALKFDAEKKKVIGDVTHSLAILQDG